MNQKPTNLERNGWGRVRDASTAVLAWVVSALAASSVGAMFGFLLGSAAVSVASAAMPLIFSLLAILGIAAGAPSLFKNLGLCQPSHWDRICVALCVCVFVVSCWFGYQRGGLVKTYVSAEKELHQLGVWEEVSPEVFSEVLLLSGEIQRRELPRAWHWSLIHYSVAPALITDDLTDEERIEFIRSLRERLPK